MTVRGPALALSLVLLGSTNCVVKPEGCDDAACTTAGGTSSDGEGDGDGGTTDGDGDGDGDADGGPVTSPAPESGDDPDPSAGSSGSTDGDEDSDDDDADSSDGTTTGEPVDNMYAPCTDDAECTSGVCRWGYCTAVCWTQIDGETPCPDAPADAVGVTIVCDNPSLRSCEGCFDCAQFCMAQCDETSTCPNGSTCIADVCTPTLTYCGGG